MYTPALPDGTFSYKKSHFGYLLKGLGIENVSILMNICNNFGTFGKFDVLLVNFVVN
jgi:hypothetical protein